MKKPPFNKDMDNLINAWCQWCVEHQRFVSLQEWMNYTLPLDVILLAQKVYEGR